MLFRSAHAGGEALGSSGAFIGMTAIAGRWEKSFTNHPAVWVSKRVRRHRWAMRRMISDCLRRCAESLTVELFWSSERRVERALRARFEARNGSGRRKRAAERPFHQSHPDGALPSRPGLLGTLSQRVSCTFATRMRGERRARAHTSPWQRPGSPITRNQSP